MKNPLFMRKWKIMVVKGNNVEAWSVSDSDSEASSLRCTFMIEESGYQTPWYSELAIWNMTGKEKSGEYTLGAILRDCQQDDTGIIIEAGYRDGEYGRIFQGDIFQPLFERRNVTDYVLTLHCIDGLGLTTGNICRATWAKGYDYSKVLTGIAQNSMTPIEVGGVTAKLDQAQAPRGKTFFGEASYGFRNVAKGNGALYWMGNKRINFDRLDDEEGASDPPVVFSPQTGLIGTPRQITYGVSFRVLLNPKVRVVRPLMKVKIDNKMIQQQKLRQGMLLSPLDESGIYKVIKVTHSGDTRGQNWYTDIVAVNLVGNVPALMARVL